MLAALRIAAMGTLPTGGRPRLVAEQKLPEPQGESLFPHAAIAHEEQAGRQPPTGFPKRNKFS